MEKQILKLSAKTVAGVIIGSSVFFSEVQAQQYPSYSGAGSTMQPSSQYQAQVSRQQADAQRRANMYYYQPAPQRQANQLPNYVTQYPDRSLRNIGMPPVVTKLSPQAIDQINGCASRGAEGAAWGWAGGKARGALVGAVQRCLNR